MLLFGVLWHLLIYMIMADPMYRRRGHRRRARERQLAVCQPAPRAVDLFRLVHHGSGRGDDLGVFDGANLECAEVGKWAVNEPRRARA